MPSLPLYQVDAFARDVFQGNPAAVCPLERWLDDATLQSISAENNLSETAFFVPRGEDYDLRWFTPTIEMSLCGHATLASAFVVFRSLRPGADTVTFHTQSGPLIVRRRGDQLAMDFPAIPSEPCEAPPLLLEGLGRAPREVRRAMDYLAVFDCEDDVRAIQPKLDAIASLDRRGAIVTAPGDRVDFVSRFFAPGAGVPEDPVTGSAHCQLIPYWSERLGRTRLVARQISARGGELECELIGNRVSMAGSAVLFLEGTIRV
jgi:predicted PhzF superfamily epimerase YddE/YHI9